MHIDSYSFGSMTVDGKEYKEDLIVFKDKIKSNWWRKEGHNLSLEDLTEVLNYKPEILIIGKGASGCMNVSEEIKRALEQRDIKVIAENTDKAYKIFNEKIKEGVDVAGAFHLTC